MSEETPLPKPVELLTALQTRIDLARSEVALRQLKADIEADPVEAEKLQREADRANSDLIVWELAAQCLRTAIEMNRRTEELLTGHLVEPERPRLRVATSHDDPDEAAQERQWRAPALSLRLA
jgi:chromosome segregation ATPase